MNTPSLHYVRRQVVCSLYCLAHTLDIQIRSGAGASMLGLDPSLGVSKWPSYGDFDLNNVDLAEPLETIYHYAFFGELRSLTISDDVEEGSLGRLAALYELVHQTWLVARNEGDVQDCHGEAREEEDGYAEMIKRATARYQLDSSPDLSLSDIATLAGIDERSVRNAMYVTGDSMLVAFRKESLLPGGEQELRVKKSEALRWLRQRNFMETKRLGGFGNLPKSTLGKEKLMPFLRERMTEFFSIEHGSTAEEILNYRYDCAGGSVGLTAETARALFESPPENLTAQDCYLIAHMIYLDFDWLRKQVEEATGKKMDVDDRQLKEILSVQQQSPLDEVAGTLIIELTDAGIRNGYFNIDRRYADRFFPADVFGDRGAGMIGNPISLHHDSKASPYVTDLRVKSDIWVSPRKRFSAYFTAHQSKAGDRIQFKKMGDRSYELIYLGQ